MLGPRIVLILAVGLGTAVGCDSGARPPAQETPGDVSTRTEAPVSSPALAPPDDATAAATSAAERWLALVDSARFDASWDAAAAYFRGAVSKEQWVAQVRGVRVPLGALRSRERDSARAATSLPGAPDGFYVVIQFRTSFENKAHAIEVVTPMRDPDGQWRVSGYYIR